MSLARELQIAHTVALEAAALVRTFVGSTIAVDHKHQGEPVTAADRAASALIVERLRAAFPDDAILSEELPDDGSRFHNERVWMVDPIDGTQDFIRGDSGYAVMIGLCVAGRPVVGVVAQPPPASSGPAPSVSAWRELADGQRRPLAPSTLAGPPGIRLVASKSHRTDDIDAFRQALSITDETNIGGVGLKVSLVADGSRDLYAYPGNRTKRWDTCAPEAILVAAGGRLTDTHGDLIDYTEKDLLNHRGIVASNGPLHEIVVATIAKLRDTAGP